MVNAKPMRPAGRGFVAKLGAAFLIQAARMTGSVLLSLAVSITSVWRMAAERIETVVSVLSVWKGAVRPRRSVEMIVTVRSGPVV